MAKDCRHKEHEPQCWQCAAEKGLAEGAASATRAIVADLRARAKTLMRECSHLRCSCRAKRDELLDAADRYERGEHLKGGE